MKFDFTTIVSVVVFGCILSVVSGATGNTVPRIQKFTDVEADMSSTDSLNDVFPTISLDFLPEDRRTPCFVDGKHKPGNITGNSVVVPHGKGPVSITFDIAPDGGAENAKLKSVSLWIQGLNKNWQGHPPNFKGYLATSMDGVHFTQIPDSFVELITPRVKKHNCIRWNFKPGEIKGFRYLRLVSLGHRKQSVRIAEIDAEITGITIRKSTRIQTQLKPIPAEKITAKLPKESQTVPSPMRVYPVRFVSNRLVLAETDTVILHMAKVFVPEDKHWKRTSFQSEDKKLTGVMTRNDGLTKTIIATIDEQNRVAFECIVQAPDKPVDYKVTLLDFSEGNVQYDGVTDGSSSVYYKGRAAHVLQIGDYSPYVIFPSKADNVELQFYIPNWYDIMGQIGVMTKQSLMQWKFFVAARNSRTELDNPKNKLNSRVWNPISRKLRPGETLKYKINIAAFTINPKRTLGQIDIEDYPHLPPLKHVDTGEEGLRLSGSSTVLHRDKMQFMGYRLPEKTDIKLGHSVLTHIIVGSQPGMIDRYERAGVGVVVITGSDYDDVSHGISHGGDYDTCPPNTREFIQELHKRNMKVVHWVSPRGFLNKKWMNRPKDPMIDKHPDWFTKHAHWGDNYQTVDCFKTEPNEWIIGKITGDMKQYGMDGVAYDSFPQAGTILGPDGNTIVANEMKWDKHFYTSIHETKDGALVIGNRAIPRFDDFRHVDSGVIENSLWMFLNETTGGHAAFGRAYTAYLQWTQLYNWWLPLSFMHHNFCDYDMGLGWTPDIWLHWRNNQIPGARQYKDMDKYVVPLWYIMGKGRRIYAACIGKHVRQIEAKMPDGSIVVVVSSINPAPMDVQAVPQNLPAGTYTLKATADTCKDHKDYDPAEIDTTKTPGIEMKNVAPFSINVLRFEKRK